MRGAHPMHGARPMHVPGMRTIDACGNPLPGTSWSGQKSHDHGGCCGHGISGGRLHPAEGEGVGGGRSDQCWQGDAASIHIPGPANKVANACLQAPKQAVAPPVAAYMAPPAAGSTPGGVQPYMAQNAVPAPAYGSVPGVAQSYESGVPGVAQSYDSGQGAVPALPAGAFPAGMEPPPPPPAPYGNPPPPVGYDGYAQKAPEQNVYASSHATSH
jgi:hypothetical protein